MADADLDVIIRQLARQQHKSLTAAVKARRDRYASLAAKAPATAIKLLSNLARLLSYRLREANSTIQQLEE